MKVVFDTNVLLSAIYTSGLCEVLLDQCVDSPEHDGFVSDHILQEFVRRSATKFRAPVADAQHAVQFLRNHMHIVQPAPVPANACRDPHDLPILGTALAASADLLVTGDKDLLVLRKFRSIPVLSPREGYERIRNMR